MSHNWIARIYRFDKGTSEETIKRVGESLMRMGYGTMPYPESALESLDRVFKMVADDTGLRYSVGRVVRLK